MNDLLLIQFCRALISELEEERDKLGEKIADGHCATYEEYKAKCGERRGLRSAVDRVKSTLEKMENDDDDL